MSPPQNTDQFDVMRYFFCGVGGLGTLMTAHLVAQSSLEADLEVVASEVHGMSQRGGSVQTSVLVGGARSPLIADGGADIFLGLEPLEALRYRAKIGPETTVVLNTEKVVPVTVTMGGPPYPDVGAIEETLSDMAHEVFAFNATELAAQAGTAKAANVVMIGAMCGLRAMPFEESHFREVLERSVPDRFLESNLRAFDAGRSAARAAMPAVDQRDVS